MQAASPVAGNGPVAAIAIVLLAAITSTVLAIACANVAGLLLARASSRRRELALRLAIGSGRLRLVTQTLAETLLVFALGAVAGIALARMMTLALLSILPTLPLPVQLSASLDWRALSFALGLSFAGALVSGLAPALLASRTHVATVLKDEAQGPRLRLRSAFVVAQIALSLILLVIGGLFLRAVAATRSRDAGLDPRGVEVAELDLTQRSASTDPGVGVTRDVLERVRALPSVEAASMARVLPLAAETLGLTITVPGLSLPGHGSTAMMISGNIVEPGYFALLRIAVQRGRDFTDRDGITARRVAIVGETAARRFWPDRDALGQTLSIGGLVGPVQDAEVIGVVRDVPYSAIGGGPAPFVYLPLQQNSVPSMTLLVRSRPGQGSADRMRAAITADAPDLPPLRFRPLDEVFALSMLPQRLGAVIAGGLGVVGILLAAMGIYGVTAYTVAQRTREFAIRTALGASRRDVGVLALRQAMLLTAIGSTIGLALAVPSGFVLSALLLDVSPVDPVTFVMAVALCATVVLAACAVPVTRAARVAAAQALKAD
jgi:predicted permease